MFGGCKVDDMSFLFLVFQLAQERQRLEAGVTNQVVVTQAQESVASAELDYINSLFAHNVAKLALARALGNAPQSLAQFLKMQ